MEPRREHALVGFFVLIVAALLLATVFSLTGAFSHASVAYRTHIEFAGGLEPGAEVRYAGGPKVGRVEALRIDPQDASRIEITFSVTPGLPVKSDSVVKIMSLSPLGENHLEVAAGSPQAPRARPGDVLPSEPYVGFNDLTAQLSALGPDARKLIQSLNDRAAELKETVARVNDLLNAENRGNIAGSLHSVRGLLEETRPKIHSTLTHVENASTKVAPLLDDLKKTIAKADKALQDMVAMLDENRPDLRQAVAGLRQTLTSTTNVAAQLDRTLDTNAENIDELLENIRHVTENLKEFTDRIKSRPALLIRSSGAPDRRPGGGKP